MNDSIKTFPAVALRGMSVLPGTIIHFDVSREKSIKAVENALLRDQHIFAVAQKDPDVEDPAFKDLYETGTICSIKQIIRLPDNIVRVLVEGLGRGGLLAISQDKPFIAAMVQIYGSEAAAFSSEAEKEARLETLRELLSEYNRRSKKFGKELMEQLLQIDTVERSTDQIILQLTLSMQERQEFLDAVNHTQRYDVLCDYLAKQNDIMRIREELSRKIQAGIDKNQKEYILREQIKIIRKELGEDDSQSQIEEYRKKTKELIASDEVKNKLNKEIDRLASIGSGNPAESGVIRTYVETLLALPWDKMSKDSEDIARARKILREDHYGLEKIKERILEFLAVRALKKKGESPIICLVGPPGTGKTSIAKSVARALDKKYIRMSLGGVKDESEIRGHRRTYVGAMPGRIVNGLKSAGVKNPLMLLDEIDKVGSSAYKGDVSSALLEVLDPEQNIRFSDHYVDIPVDLSEVLFIATANDASGIPKPLLDRMELIEVTSYTENEKLHIAKEYLLPKQMEANGISKKELSVSDRVMSAIISGYTREAGVRRLEQLIGKICRKTALAIHEQKKTKVTITLKNLEDYLGRKKYNIFMANKAPETGIARGLAWTSVGGDTLQIEVNTLTGKGELKLTGHLGDVMKESAMIALSYVRSIAKEYGVSDAFFTKHSIHIHVPDGAVPKDGPSAGITMATAILSAASGIKVRFDVAMTGEITLRGKVRPVGGLKEKLLAAVKADIKTVLVPLESKPDIIEIDKEITDPLRIVYVSDMKEVLKEALLYDNKKGGS